MMENGMSNKIKRQISFRFKETLKNFLIWAKIDIDISNPLQNCYGSAEPSVIQ
jgi:hypothetical protein